MARPGARTGLRYSLRRLGPGLVPGAAHDLRDGTAPSVGSEDKVTGEETGQQ